MGRLGWVLAWTAGAFVLGTLSEDVAMVRAQESTADSTVTAPGFPFADAPDSTAVEPASNASAADSASVAAADSAAIAALRQQMEREKGFVWIDFLGDSGGQRPSIKGTYNSERARFGTELDFSLPLSALGGFNSTTTYHRDRFQEPATQQKKANQNFFTDWQRPMSSWGQFGLNFRTTRGETDSERAGLSTTENTALTSSLSGLGTLGQTRIDGRWSIRGSLTKTDTRSALTTGSTDQELSKGGVSGGLGRRIGPWSVSMNAGLDASAGPQTLSAATDGSDAREDTKTTQSDTLGVKLRWQGGENRNLTAEFSRNALTEERLDYLKDTRGVTLTDPQTGLRIVGNEREVRDQTRVDLRLQDRLIRNVGYNLHYGIDRRETEYRLNQQNFVPSQAQTFGGELSYRYAAAGSLSVALDFIERWDDRKLRGSENFRGKAFNNSSSISFTVDQRILSTAKLRVLYAEDLTRRIYEYKLSQGTQDIDVLGRRLEGRLSANPYDALNFTLLGSYRTSANVNLDADQVARNNRDLDNWKVTMDYRLALTPSLSFGQSYQLSIDYTDYYYSFLEDDSQRDKYYKRTQMKSDLQLDFREGSSFTLSHVIDRTRGGTKEFIGAVEDTAYTDDLSRRQDEHRIYAGVRVPVFRYNLEVGTNRSIRTTRGTDDEFLGDLRIQLSGQRKFLGDHLALGLNIGHVWAYGPPRLIRSDRDRRYFTSSTHLTWIF